MNFLFRISNFSEKNRAKMHILALLVLVAISSLIALIYLSSLKSAGIYLYYKRVVTTYLEGFLKCIIIVVGGLPVAIPSSGFFRVIVIILTLVILCYVGVNSLNTSWDPEREYYHKSSPLGGQEIIIEECSWLLGGWSNVYVKLSDHRIKRLSGTILTNNGYRPFQNNDYFISWTEDAVTITYGDSGGKSKASITLQLTE